VGTHRFGRSAAMTSRRKALATALALAAATAPVCCSRVFAAEPWPAEPRAAAADLSAPLLGGEPSGAAWHAGLERLFIADDRGRIVAMNADAGDVVVIGSLPVDIEAVACNRDDPLHVYVGLENPPTILRLDLATQSVAGQWNLAEMLVGAADTRLEGLAFLPDAYASAVRRLDDGSLYNEGRGSAFASGGLFLAAHQGNGRIYVFDVDLATPGPAVFVSFYGPIVDEGQTLTDLSGLAFDETTAAVYALWDDPIDGEELGRVAALDPLGEFDVVAIWKTATDSHDEEGIAVLGTGSGGASLRMVIAEDDVAKHPVWRYDGFPRLGATTTTTTLAPSCACGDPNGDGVVTATDALMVLRGAVGSLGCPACLCDVDGGGGVTALDALMTLGVSIGRDLPLACPACAGCP
jgi:hypothetical protein